MTNGEITCPCGASSASFGALKSRRPYLGGSWYVACIKCGRVGHRARTEKKAIIKWQEACEARDAEIARRGEHIGVPRPLNRQFMFGPLEDDDGI